MALQPPKTGRGSESNGEFQGGPAPVTTLRDPGWAPGRGQGDRQPLGAAEPGGGGSLTLTPEPGHLGELIYEVLLLQNLEFQEVYFSFVLTLIQVI